MNTIDQKNLFPADLIEKAPEISSLKTKETVKQEEVPATFEETKAVLDIQAAEKMGELKKSADGFEKEIITGGGNEDDLNKFKDDERKIEEKAGIAKEEYENSFITPGIIEGQIAEKKDEMIQPDIANLKINKAEDTDLVRKSRKHLEDIGIDPHLDESKVFFYKDKKFNKKGNQTTGVYSHTTGLIEGYGLGSDEQEKVRVLMHEGTHQAITKSLHTSKERKKINEARIAVTRTEIHVLNNRIKDIIDQVDWEKEDPKRINDYLDKIREQIRIKEKYLETFEEANIRFSEGLSCGEAVDRLEKYVRRNKGLPEEAYAYFIDDISLNYDPETDKIKKVSDIDNKKFAKERAREAFGKKNYDSKKDESLYLSLHKLYRKLSENIPDQNKIFQIIMPFSKYTMDENEIENIMSSKSNLNEFMALVNKTEDKRNVAKEWMNIVATKRAADMFKNEEEKGKSLGIKKAIKSGVKKIKKHFK